MVILFISLYSPAIAFEPSPVCLKFMKSGIQMFSSSTSDLQWGGVKKSLESKQCPLTLKFLSYAYYLSPKNNEVNPLNIIIFLKKNPSWPEKKKLRKRIEFLAPKAFPKKIPIALISWFSAHPPTQGKSILLYMKGLQQHNKNEKTLKIAVKNAWYKGKFSENMEKIFYNTYKKFLTESDNWKRTNNALWDKNHSVAKRMLSKLSKNHKLLAQTRLYLQKKKEGLGLELAPSKFFFIDHIGFLYDNIVWHREKRKNDAAFSLSNIIKSPKVNPARFWRERHILARRALEEKAYQRAYDLASNHGLSSGKDFANAEFLAGWLALRYLRKPEIAEKKFQNLYNKVYTPISKSRAAYWLGRTYDAQNKLVKAKRAYKDAARFRTTFYGQQASEILELATDIYLFKKYKIDEKTKFIVENRNFAKLLKMFSKIPSSYDWQKAIIMNFAFQAKGHSQKIYTLKFIFKYAPNFASDVARIMNIQGEIYIEQAFPSMHKKYIHGRVEPSLAWAIMRRESGFDYKAISCAGAMGLMQLMPKTARRTAKKHRIKLPYLSHLLEKPHINVKIGTAHLEDLLSRYKGIYPFVIAAYNAGYENVNEWIKIFGNPAKGQVDWLDWLESIPLFESRYYVQRVLESLHIYRVNYGDKHASGPLSLQELK